MQDSNRWAFKEWAAICSALLAGRQSLILRKGGIHEGREGFRVEHPEFWLFATGFHQQADALTDDAAKLATLPLPQPGTVCLPGYVTVDAVEEIRDPMLLPRLAGQHVWSDRTVEERFHYRTPGLLALIVRVFRPETSTSLVLPESPHFGGCRSWVDLPGELPTTGLVPVIEDPEHAVRVTRLRQLLMPATTL